MNVTTLEAARDIRKKVIGDADSIEYLARVALLIREFEWDDDLCCPMCSESQKSGHTWQCDMAGALDTLDGFLK